MARLIILFTAIALASVAFAVVEYPLTHHHKTVNQIDNYTKEISHTNVKLMKATRNDSVRRRFIAGRHMYGDPLAAKENVTYNYPEPQDVSVNLRYPQSGTGLNVTFIDIMVKQSSDIGNIYIVSGGIGQRYVEVRIEANYTTFLNYNAEFFAK